MIELEVVQDAEAKIGRQRLDFQTFQNCLVLYLTVFEVLVMLDLLH